MKKKANPSRLIIAALALAVIPLSGIAIDIYVPSLPAVAHFFHADKSLAQLSITTYMLGLGIVQIFAGSLADSFGRKLPYLIAMLIFMIATLLVPLSSSMYELLILRFIQGSAVALTVVPMRSVILDLFEGRELKKMTNYMTLVWSIGPIIAPMLGGYLAHYFGWQSCFYFLFAYAIVVLILSLFLLPETSKERHPFRLNLIIKRYITILFNTKFLIGVCLAGTMYSLVLLFSVLGPFLMQNILHFTPVGYGNISLLMGFAWFLGIVTNRFLIDVPIQTKTKYNLCGILLCVIIFLFLASHYPVNAYFIIVPYLFILLLAGMLFPNYFGRSVSLFPRITGSANALFGSLVFLIAGLSTAFGSLLKSNTAVPLGFAILALVFISFILYYLDRKTK